MKSSICVCDNAEALSRSAAKHIVAAMGRKLGLLLCAAGGSTPSRTYELLAKSYARRPQAFRKVRLVKLDEWGGLPMGGPGTCEYQLQKLLISPLRISRGRYFGFKSNPADPEAECRRIPRRLAAEGPIDLCVLGLGMNGHIAMNEPGPSLKLHAHVARLAKVTLNHPMLSKSRSTPTFGLSLGVGEILSSKEILLLVSGANKRQPLRTFLRREVSTHFPASLLWLHPNWTLFCDRDAAEGLNLNL